MRAGDKIVDQFGSVGTVMFFDRSGTRAYVQYKSLTSPRGTAEKWREVDKLKHHA